jgi:16S rRNA (cytosine967-C5)-methyltransferase
MAAAILLRITDHGAYSNVVLAAGTRGLASADRAFVYSLVTGALRRLRTADTVIADATGRDVGELDPEVRTVLEVAIGELLDGQRDAVYATVNESVDAIKQLGQPRASGLVNGVLRRLLREGMPGLPPDRARDLSVPEWVLGKLTADHGRQTARELLDGLRTSPGGTGVRVRPGATAPAGAIPVADIPGTYIVDGVPGDDTGLVIADPASTAVALAVAAEPKERILDMAAAPGGKTSAIWDETGGALDLIAMDRHRRRLQSARERLDALGVRPRWVIADGTGAPFRDGMFDAVLLDAPCTGLGTLRRRPEIAMRLKPKGMATLVAQQSRLLAEAWRVVRPGGRIVYSVCTLFADETVAIVADYPAAPPDDLPGVRWGSGILLAPHLTRTDGMFVSIIRRPG